MSNTKLNIIETYLGRERRLKVKKFIDGLKYITIITLLLFPSVYMTVELMFK